MVVGFYLLTKGLGILEASGFGGTIDKKGFIYVVAGLLVGFAGVFLHRYYGANPRRLPKTKEEIEMETLSKASRQGNIFTRFISRR